MKLRIRDNSIRFRLTRTEVHALRHDGSVSAELHFSGGASIHYVVESSPDGRKPGAYYTNNTIGLRIPVSIVNTWADSDQISVSAEETLSANETLILLLEKDFTCLTERSGEDESDMFPNPHERQERD